MKVWISQRARRNLDDILQYLENKWSERVKKKFLKILLNKIDLLSKTPLMYEASSKKRSVRRCVVTRQVILYYRIADETIEIVTIQDARRDPGKLKV